MRRRGYPGKRLLDVPLGLCLLAPLMAAVAVLLSWESGTAPLELRPTVGVRGRRFLRVVFRAPRGRPGRAAVRIAESFLLGAPQLWNVLLGQMSLVGPAPLSPAEAIRIVSRSPGGSARFSVAPGLFGPLRLAPPDLPRAQRLEAELLYARTCTLATDLAILAAR
ncbi:MAG: sugar transferase [Candidatus Eremiobacterota bacterium]